MLLVFSSVQPLSRVWPLATPRTAARQASLSVSNSRSPVKLMSIASVIREKQRRGHSCWQSVTGVFRRMAPGGRTQGLSCEWEGAPGALLRAVGENTSPTFKRHKRCMLSEKSNCEALWPEADQITEAEIYSEKKLKFDTPKSTVK